MKTVKYIVSEIVLMMTCMSHTTQPLSKRMAWHRDCCKKDRHTSQKLYQTMNELGIDNFYIELLQKCPCDDKEELRAEEGIWI